MKSIFVFLILFTSSTLLAGSRVSTELFTEKQTSEIIQAIDNICADTWCEGDYNFEFIDFSCNKSVHTCDLTFHFIETDDDNVQTYSALQTCHFTNITKFKQIKQSKNSLNHNFYEELTDCITTLEDQLKF